MTDRADMTDAFIDDIGWADAARVLVAGDASNRRYERLTKPDGSTAILMDAPRAKGEDVRPFVRIADHLVAQGLSAPAIYHQDPNLGFLLIEDLGDDRFAELMLDDPSRQETLYRAATDMLVHLHQAPQLTLPKCDAAWLTEATALVFEWYAPEPIAQQAFNEKFHPLALALENTPSATILRDFHAENLLWLPLRKGVAKVGVLDFQDALEGHPAYDLVSILQDARRDVDPAIEAQMITHYLAQTSQNPIEFRSAYALLGAQRNLRILGIFARLCLRDGKAHYVNMIPRVWEYVMRNLADPSLADIRPIITNALPEPTPAFLEQLKNRCKTVPS